MIFNHRGRFDLIYLVSNLLKEDLWIAHGHPSLQHREGRKVEVSAYNTVCKTKVTLPLWGRGVERGLGLSPPTVCQALCWLANSTTATGQTTQPVPLEGLLELTTLVDRSSLVQT